MPENIEYDLPADTPYSAVENENRIHVRIKGLAMLKSPDAIRIFQENFNEVIAAFVQDETALEPSLFDTEIVPEELTQLRMGKIVKDKDSELDEEGRETVGALFSDITKEGHIESGMIYILRSKSDHPLITQHRDVIHKIGVTSGDIEKRLSNAKLDPTFLMADVKVVATYELSNINRVRLEKLIHKFFEPSRLNIEIIDSFGNPIVPREWFLVPRFVIDEAVEKIKEGTVVKYQYNAKEQKITELKYGN